MLRQVAERLAAARGEPHAHPAPERAPTIAILGAGAGGLCMAMRLKHMGITSFTIFEKAGGVGGTWRDNTYPGACCDVKSHLYSFSFEPNPRWSSAFAGQPEILDYLEHCAEHHDLERHIRFDTEITSLRFDDAVGHWELTTSVGEVLFAEVVVSALGQLSRPLIPRFEGLDTFEGTVFHSARWDHDHDLTGRRVAVIGNAASAVQFVPQIAPDCEHVDVYQRSANWVLPKPNPSYGALRKWAFGNVPGALELHRWSIYWSFELRWLAFRDPPLLRRPLEALCRAQLRMQVRDPQLRARLTPDYPLGCKRVLASSDYLPAVAGDGVALQTSPVTRFTPQGILTHDGAYHPVDTVIFATGFDTTHFLAPMEVSGRDGRRLQDAWEEGAEAYLGMAVAGFPNLFMLYGPNTNLGHNSILFMIECQVEYILRCLQELAGEEPEERRWLDVRPEVMASYNRWVQETVGETVWAGRCQSWYKTASGKVTNNWPAGTVRYWRETIRPRFGAYARGPEVPARAS